MGKPIYGGRGEGFHAVLPTLLCRCIFVSNLFCNLYLATTNYDVRHYYFNAIIFVLTLELFENA